MKREWLIPEKRKNPRNIVPEVSSKKTTNLNQSCFELTKSHVELICQQIHDWYDH